MCYIPDPCELMEMRAERWEWELRAEDGKYLCVECRVPHEMKDMTCASADPAAPPICWDCLKKVDPELVHRIEEDTKQVKNVDL